MDLNTILCVDDDADVQQLLMLSVTQVGGWKYLQATDGKTALALAATEKPDLILLDYTLGDTTGPELLNELRQHPDSASIPVVFLTGDVAHREELLASDAVAVISKPIDPIDLPTQLRELAAGL